MMHNLVIDGYRAHPSGEYGEAPSESVKLTTIFRCTRCQLRAMAIRRFSGAPCGSFRGGG